MIKIKRGLDIPITGTPEQEIHDAAQLFISTRSRGFPVTMDDNVVGQINRSDILKALLSMCREPFMHPKG